MTSTVHTLARYQTALQSRKLAQPLDELLEDLVTFLTAGIESVPMPASRDAAASRRPGS